MLNEKNILGVKDWNENTRELEQQLEETQHKLHFSRTIVERQKLEALQNEVAEGFKRVKELNKKSYEVAIANKAKIKRLTDEAEKLRLESLELSIDEWELENKLRAKRVEIYQLEKAIADNKNLV